jgi:hypothetical protein
MLEERAMTASDELQQWLMMNVGSRQAEECLAIVERVIAERTQALEDQLEDEKRGVDRREE